MKPTVMIEDSVYKKVMHWVNKSRFEVSGLGIVRVEKDGILRVVDAILLPQKNGSAHTDIEPEDVNRALFQMRETPGDLRWWWHSHVQMQVFWSGTDHDTIKKVGKGGWFACTVFNQKNEVKSCYYAEEGQRTPWGTMPLMIDDLPTKVTMIEDPREVEWNAEYEKNVKIAVPEFKSYGMYGRDWRGEDTAAGESGAGKAASKWVYDPATPPPLHKPKVMPKNTFKEWNTAHVQFIAQSRDEKQLALVDQLGRRLPSMDEYGFTQDERGLLAQEGWTEHDFDELFDQDISPSEILRMAKLGVSPTEVQYLMEESNYTAEDITALLDQSDSFGENLFESPSIYRRRSGE